MLRDAMRHLLALLLMAGTLAGTIWTFSDGALTLNAALERLISVGGVGAALECGAIYCGWYIGQLDIRIKAASKRDLREDLAAYQAELYRWFYAVIAISAIANFVFRVQQLNNWLLAAFVSVAPIILIILFTVKLRPLPQDHADMARQTAQRTLVTVQEVAGEVMIRGMRRMARGEIGEDEMRRLAYAASFVMPYAPTDQQHALGAALTQSGAGDSPRLIEGGANERWLRTAEVRDLFNISERTAQLWVSQTPGRRKVTKGNGWEVPASVLYSARGVPALSSAAPAAPAERPPSAATSPQVAALAAPLDAPCPL